MTPMQRWAELVRRRRRWSRFAANLVFMQGFPTLWNLLVSGVLGCPRAPVRDLLLMRLLEATKIHITPAEPEYVDTGGLERLFGIPRRLAVDLQGPGTAAS